MSDEQRRPAGCPARELYKESRFQGTSMPATIAGDFAHLIGARMKAARSHGSAWLS